MGKKYDASWLQQDFPGFASDIDWKVFNAASPDQWWEDRDTLPPGAKWRIWNMHPEKPMQEGQLPPWQARCFIHRQRADETLFEEIALRATTVWFFPHREQMMLIWQGHIRINEDDAADVLQLIPALEKEGAARSLNHYRKVLAQRMDKEKGALFSFREKDLIPEETIGPWIDNEIEQSPSPQQENMKTAPVCCVNSTAPPLKPAAVISIACWRISTNPRCLSLKTCRSLSPTWSVRRRKWRMMHNSASVRWRRTIRS